MPKIQDEIELGPYQWESSIDIAEDIEDTINDLVDGVGEWPGTVRVIVQYEREE